MIKEKKSKVTKEGVRKKYEMKVKMKVRSDKRNVKVTKVSVRKKCEMKVIK